MLCVTPLKHVGDLLQGDCQQLAAGRAGSSHRISSSHNDQTEPQSMKAATGRALTVNTFEMCRRPAEGGGREQLAAGGAADSHHAGPATDTVTRPVHVVNHRERIL